LRGSRRRWESVVDAWRRQFTDPISVALSFSLLQYILEFISDDPYRDVQTFLLTASAIGMLYKRGATISAGELQNTLLAEEYFHSLNLSLSFIFPFCS